MIQENEVFGLKIGETFKVEVYKSTKGFNAMASQFENVVFFMNDSEEEILKTLKIKQ